MYVGVGVLDDPLSKPEPTSALTGSSYYICRGGYQPPANAAIKTNTGYIRTRRAGTSPTPTARTDVSDPIPVILTSFRPCFFGKKFPGKKIKKGLTNHWRDAILIKLASDEGLKTARKPAGRAGGNALCTL